MTVTEAVEDLHGIVHAVMMRPDFNFTGSTACGFRFHPEGLGSPALFLGRYQRMEKTDKDVNCMSCLVCLPIYDET